MKKIFSLESYYREKKNKEHQEAKYNLYPGKQYVFEIGGTSFKMRWIPSGKFLMGAGEDDFVALWSEKPQRKVTITRGFWMGETPVTQRQYQAIMGKNPSYFKKAGLDAPVEQVSWCDAAAFANKLSEIEGLSACFVGTGKGIRGVGNKGSDYIGRKGWRLPTEAEWEYACRAGITSPRYGALDEIAWHYGNSTNKTRSVGQKQANAWGLYDMLGNVGEWFYDVYGGGGYGWGEPTTDPLCTGGAGRGYRGGSWFNAAWFVRSAARFGFEQTDRRSNLIGFRLVRTNP